MKNFSCGFFGDRDCGCWGGNLFGGWSIVVC